MRLPIRARLTLVFSGLLLVVLVLSGIGLSVTFRVWLEHGVRREIGALAKEFATDVVAGEVGILEDYGPTEPPESFAQLLAADGKMMATTRGINAPLVSVERLARLGDNADLTVDRTIDQTRGPERVLLRLERTSRGPIVVVGSSLHAPAALQRTVTTMATGIGAGILFVVTGLGWMLSGAALRPVERLRREVSQITETDLSRTLAVPPTGDEIARLAETMNAMLDRLGQAFARERRLLDDASHELRTPLAVLRTELDLALRQSRTREELQAALASAAQESDRLNRLADNLLVLARLNRGAALLKRSPVDLSDIVAHCGQRFEAAAATKGVALAVAARAGLEAEVDELRIEQAIDNLLVNAIAHTPKGGRIELVVARDAPRTFAIIVSDTGPGFPPDFLPKAFEQFSRADSARARDTGGAGLGLAIVLEVAKAHGGSARIENLPSGGARVTVTVPYRAPMGSPGQNV